MKVLFSFVSLLFITWVLNPTMIETADIVGTWIYEVSDVPPEHAQGEIVISIEDEVYKAEIKTAGGMIILDDLKVDDNKVSFSVMVEGSDVQVEMTFDGDTMSGKAESYDGVFIMKGSRKK